MGHRLAFSMKRIEQAHIIMAKKICAQVLRVAIRSTSSW